MKLLLDVGENFGIGTKNVENISIGPPQEIGEASAERGPGGKRGAAVGSSEEADAARMCED